MQLKLQRQTAPIKNPKKPNSHPALNLGTVQHQQKQLSVIEHWVQDDSNLIQNRSQSGKHNP